MLHFYYLFQPYLFSHAPFIQQGTPNSLSISRTFCLIPWLMFAPTQIAYFTTTFFFAVSRILTLMLFPLSF